METIPFAWLCPPCQRARHDLCLGAAVFCCCLAEILMEAEEQQ